MSSEGGVGTCAEGSLPVTSLSTWNQGTAPTSTPGHEDLICECSDPDSDEGVCLHQAPGLLGPRQFRALGRRCWEGPLVLLAELLSTLEPLEHLI